MLPGEAGIYVLAEPKWLQKNLIVKEIHRLLLNARIQLMKAYKRQYKSAAK